MDRPRTTNVNQRRKTSVKKRLNARYDHSMPCPPIPENVVYKDPVFGTNVVLKRNSTTFMASPRNNRTLPMRAKGFQPKQPSSRRKIV